MLAALSLVLGLSSAFAAEVTLYAVKSPLILNWKTPSSLFLTALGSELAFGAPRSIGHVFVGYRCGEGPEVISGSTSGPSFNSRDNLLKNGHGMSVLLEDNLGELETDAMAREDIAKLAQTRRMAVMRLEISQAQCLTMQQWHKEYAARTPMIYGGVGRRPLRGEGAGCSAYAMSFMEIADAEFTTLNRLFEKTIYLPEHLLGGEYGKRRVRLWSLLKDRTPLAQPAEGALEVKLYDPNTLYQWIRKEWKAARRGEADSDLPGYQRSISKLGRAPVVRFTR